MFEEITVVDKIEVLASNHIQVRQAKIVKKDGIEIARTLHRYVLDPNSDLTGQDAKIVAIATAVWNQQEE